MYSVIIVSSLILLITFIFTILSVKDYKDSVRKNCLNKYYDVGQSLIIHYQTNRFHKSHGFFNLFIYMVKVT